MTRALLMLACVLLCFSDGALARGVFTSGVRYRTSLAPAFYIATGGSDSNPGTLAAPFATLTAARTAMRNSSTKKTTYIRAGTYSPAAQTSTCGGTAAIQLNSSDIGETWSYYPPDGPGTAILDGGSTADLNGLFIGFCIDGGSNGVVIDGLQMQRYQFGMIQVYDPNVTIRNSTFHDYTHNGNNGAINIGGSTAQNASVLNNYIYNARERGITAGPCFSNCGGGINNLLIQGNYVQNSCTNEPDCGAIYIVDFQTPRSSNIRILNNYVRDVYTTTGGGRGIYLDDGTSGVTATGNIVAGANCCCIQIHGSSNDVFTGNLCDMATKSSASIVLSQNGDVGSGGNNGPGNVFQNNIVISGMSSSGVGYDGDPSVIPSYDHIVVVVEENHSESEIVGSSSAPFINNTLIADGALMTNYKAITHPSEPNYFALYAGSTFNVTDDGDYSEPDPTLATVLQAAGKTFTGYIETASPQKHNPWESFPEGTSVEKDFSLFPASNNYASLPSVSFVIPDLNDDMHDGTIRQGDTWLQNNIAAYETWAKTHNSLLIITWDEDDSSGTNQVATIFDGAGITHGSFSNSVNHYNLLSTIAAINGVTAPRNGGTASPITAPLPVTTPVVKNNFYHNYVGTSVNSGGVYSDSHPVTGDPLINGWTYTISGSSPAFNSPVSFSGLPSSWGPPGFVVPQTGTAPSNPH